VRRREFITLLGGAAAWPLAARAQQPAMPVIGFLSAGLRDSVLQYSLPAFHLGLKEAGYIEGQNLTIEYRWADGHYDRLPALASQLVQHPVTVIVAVGGTASALAAKATSTKIPIVFNLGSDPVKVGLVASLNRPGDRITGVSYLNASLEPKRLEMLHELVPKATTVAVLVNPNFPDAESQVREVQAAARATGQEIVLLNASTEHDFDAAFATIIEQRISGLMVQADPFLTASREQLVLLTTRHAIPTIFAWREFAAAGGLMSYGTSLADAYRQVGIYAGRVLSGIKPGDLPVQQSVKVELVLNFKAAKALGITFPLTLLGRADEVIE
jgi:putative ABC transport system substrate-binding protein